MKEFGFNPRFNPRFNPKGRHSDQQILILAPMGNLERPFELICMSMGGGIKFEHTKKSQANCVLKYPSRSAGLNPNLC